MCPRSVFIPRSAHGVNGQNEKAARANGSCLGFRYTIESSDAGVGVSYSAMRRVVSLERVADAYAADLTVYAKEGVTARHIVK